MDATLRLRVDGTEHTVAVDVRTTLLDALRERVGVTSPKKGCDHGQCGSCTVLLDGRRHLTCLTLAVAHDGAEVVTAEGLGRLAARADSMPGSVAVEQALHPVQRAFLDRDGLQCGYCTPGQICSAVGMLEEAGQGHPSHVTEDLAADVELTDDEIRERMSGNLCRCGAYRGILDAVRDVARPQEPTTEPTTGAGA
ncbi:2Fe-2S iron-sulfur cluster-binding protein [Nocardioides campestrisoli]|uniref:2Fe-2S iron-sulfur cluster-binding protein n=1 Tax=Nocardioides campestrisoli TaxID=2736757 RepID=UPI00163DC6B3|nr:2Fe-2S iron-sulfur cluster-binding protein [Nocardioides campestrisoli]